MLMDMGVSEKRLPEPHGAQRLLLDPTVFGAFQEGGLKESAMDRLRAVMACVVVGLVVGCGGVAHALPVSTGLLGWYDANDLDGNPATANLASGTAVARG